MKRSFLLLFLFVFYGIKAQTTTEVEISSEGSTLTANINSLKADYPFRMNKGISKIIPVFEGNKWDEDSKAAVEYACKLMEERLLTTCPILVKMIRDSSYPIAYVNTRVFSTDLTGNPNASDYLYTNCSNGNCNYGERGFLIPLATSKRHFIISSRNLEYFNKNNSVYSSFDGTIFFSVNPIFSSSLNGVVEPNTYDLVTVTLRELAKILGMTVGTTTRVSADGIRVYTESEGVKRVTPYAAVLFKYKDTDFWDPQEAYNYATSTNVKCNYFAGLENSSNYPTYDIHSPAIFNATSSLLYFKEDVNNDDTRLLQPTLPMGTSIHKIGDSFLNVLKYAFWEILDYNTSAGGGSASYQVDTQPKSKNEIISFNINNRLSRNSNSNLLESEIIENIIYNASFKEDNLSQISPRSSTTLSSNDIPKEGYHFYHNDGIIFDFIFGNNPYARFGWAMYLLKKDGSLHQIATLPSRYEPTLTVNLNSLNLNYDEYARTSDGYLRARINYNGSDLSGEYSDPFGNLYNFARYISIKVEPATPKLSLKKNDLRSGNNTSIYYKDYQVCYDNMEGVTEARLFQKEYYEGELISTIGYQVDIFAGQHTVTVDKELTTTFQLVTRNDLGEKSSQILTINPEITYSLFSVVNNNELELGFKNSNDIIVEKEIESTTVLSTFGGIQKTSVNNRKDRISLHNCAPGVYTVVATDKDGKRYTSKFVKK